MTVNIKTTVKTGQYMIILCEISDRESKSIDDKSVRLDREKCRIWS